MARTWIALATGMAVASLLLASAASAGSYHVYSCRMPNGEAAPVDGWSGAVAPGGAYDDYALDTCESGGALVAALGDATVHAANVDRATWVFVAPAWVRVAGATLWRAGDTAGGFAANGTYQFWAASPGPTSIFDECIASLLCAGEGELQHPESSVNRVAVPTADLGSPLTMSASCGGQISYQCHAGQGDANNYAAVLDLFAADLTLEQSSGPAVSNVGGELATAATIEGTADLTFGASDPGSGVYDAAIAVDGQVVQRTVLDENGGRCRDVGQTTDGLPAFLYVQPCAASVSADVGLDTTRVPNGRHHVVVTVADAAGNAATVLDREITLANPSQLPPGAGSGVPPSSGSGSAQGGAAAAGGTAAASAGPNGSPATTQATLSVSWRSARGSRLISAYGRGERIVGRLLGPGGVPVAGALIEVQATAAYSGARASSLSSPRTAPDGSFAFRLAGGVSSRTLVFSYRAHLGDPFPAASRALSLVVRASVALHVAPRVASVGRHIFFTGRLAGGPIPAEGKALVLEARSPGGTWIEFDVVRSDRRGRFHASYRFRFPGPATYEFRALCEAEGDYPYATAASNSVRVREL